MNGAKGGFGARKREMPSAVNLVIGASSIFVDWLSLSNNSHEQACLVKGGDNDWCRGNYRLETCGRTCFGGKGEVLGSPRGKQPFGGWSCLGGSSGGGGSQSNIRSLRVERPWTMASVLMPTRTRSLEQGLYLSSCPLLAYILYK